MLKPKVQATEQKVWLQLEAAHLKATGSDHMRSFFSKSLRFFTLRLRQGSKNYNKSRVLVAFGRSKLRTNAAATRMHMQRDLRQKKRALDEVTHISASESSTTTACFLTTAADCPFNALREKCQVKGANGSKSKHQASVSSQERHFTYSRSRPFWT